MKTSDIFNSRSSKKLNEGIEKTFGKSINLESFSLQQLEDSRNRLRTQIYQIRSNSAFNELVENDSYTRAQWMLDAINSAIEERGQPVEEITTQEGFSSEVEMELHKLAQEGDTDKVYDLLTASSDLGRAVQDMYDEVSRDYGLHPDDDVDEIMDRLMDRLEDDYGDPDMDPEEGGDTDDDYALASAGHGSDEDYGRYEGQDDLGDNMNQVRESATDKASAVVTAKTMVDRVGRWIEELAGMENDTLLSLGDTIRDEMGQEQAKAFLSAVAPAIQQALENLKATRETLATGVRGLTGEVQPAELIGSEEETAPEAEVGPAEPDTMNAGEETPGEEDEFAAAEPAAGGVEVAGRAQRESIERSNQLLRVLAG